MPRERASQEAERKKESERMGIKTFTSPSTNQEIQASVEPGRNKGEKIVSCTWVQDGYTQNVQATWLEGEGWEDDTLGAWSPIIEGLFNLKVKSLARGGKKDEMTEQNNEQYAVVVYEMKDGTEKRFPVQDSEDLKHERAQAEREVHDPKSYVKGYRVE